MLSYSFGKGQERFTEVGELLVANWREIYVRTLEYNRRLVDIVFQKLQGYGPINEAEVAAFPIHI